MKYEIIFNIVDSVWIVQTKTGQVTAVVDNKEDALLLLGMLESR